MTIFVLLMTIITIVVFTLPFVYRSEGRIAIEAPVISNDVVKTVSAANYVDESIDKVKQKVLSRKNLSSLNQKYGLYPEMLDEKKLALILMKNITFTSETKDTSRNTWENQKVTVGLIVGFEYSDPETTYQVANEIIKQLLEENVRSKTKQASETTGFLTGELDRLKEELELVENKVAVYKQKYANSLPEHQEMHMASLEQIRTAIKDLGREYKNTQEELRYLDVEYTTTSASFNNGADALDPLSTVSALDKARAELNRSLVLYKETHPTVRALKRKVALLEKAPVATKENAPVRRNPVKTLALAKIKTQIESANVRLGSITSQKRSMSHQLATLQRQIVQIPQVESGLSKLQRDYDNAKAKYEDVKSKQINAKIAENLALANKGERFILKQSPEFPKFRESPKRTLLMALGVFGSLILGFLFAFLLEMLDPRVRGQATISSIVDAKLLAVIPYIETHTELARKKKIIKFFSVGMMVLIVLCLIAATVHFFVAPLNTLLIAPR
ncbi:MAG: lipopolysaccharide biosynthesis protein [Methylophilaceae bacterium]|nr:MAG: lipopolysaccharide biosynthesis protein [Methylophilaceae bacterium]